MSASHGEMSVQELQEAEALCYNRWRPRWRVGGCCTIICRYFTCRVVCYIGQFSQKCLHLRAVVRELNGELLRTGQLVRKRWKTQPSLRRVLTLLLEKTYPTTTHQSVPGKRTEPDRQWAKNGDEIGCQFPYGFTTILVERCRFNTEYVYGMTTGSSYLCLMHMCVCVCVY